MVENLERVLDSLDELTCRSYARGYYIDQYDLNRYFQKMSGCTDSELDSDDVYYSLLDIYDRHARYVNRYVNCK